MDDANIFGSSFKNLFNMYIACFLTGKFTLVLITYYKPF